MQIVDSLHDMTTKPYIRERNWLNKWHSGLSVCGFARDWEEQIRRVFDDNWRIILSVLHKNICCGCSLESPRRGDSNEHPQHMFLWRKKAKLSLNYHEIPSLSVPLIYRIKMSSLHKSSESEKLVYWKRCELPHGLNKSITQGIKNKLRAFPWLNG